MNRISTVTLAIALLASTIAGAAEPPLRIFLRSGPKSHAPGAHDYPRFLREWVPLLNQRGARATGEPGKRTSSWSR